ncbi:hypothetical protein [Legionella quateirensis]|uniref:Major outer membrane protein n=1 Tax=Legionella quateirensis TaxID=45072 RepID=A0A378KY47_9GAMM|nr:hypothetical protein [Legionella quateirensis]KTD44924.1 hypothetical protein Lqua_2759 [Legionella quateirensis]STY19453.1 Uncharacterised protein [Legionella quateirensis]
MRTKIFLTVLMLFVSTAYSKVQAVESTTGVKSKQEIEQLIQLYLKPKGVFNTSYDEFKFSSYQGAAFNHYSGHSNFISAGADNLNFYNFYWGINAYNITTNTNTTSRLTNDLSQSHGSIEDNGVFLHVMKQVVFPVFVDVFASFGRDRFKQTNLVNGDTANAVTGRAHYYGHDSTVGARTFFGQSYKQLYLQGYLTYFYSTFYQPNFIFEYPIDNVSVPSLTSKVGTLIEHARLYYQVNEHFSPFVSGSLIQITSRSFSRPLVDQNLATISALPQLLLAKNGYNYGVGVDYHYKTIRVTPSYVHTVRGNTFSDNYVSVNFELTGLD